MEIGIIKNYQSFISLSIGIDISTGWSVAGGKLISPANVSQPLQFSYVSGLWKWKKTTVANKKSLKLFINNTAGNFTGEFYINSQNKLCSFFSYDNSTLISTDFINWNTGELLEFSISKDAWSIIFSVKNLTTNQTVTLNATNMAISIHKLRLIASEVTEIFSYKLESTQTVGGTYVVGDSITYGSSATSPLLSWVGLVGWNRLCGAGDRSADAVLLMEEILNYAKPERVVFAMGTNDSNIDVWKNNLQTFKNQMKANKITFIPVCPYANNIRSMQGYRDYIVANFSVYFDFYTATKQSNNTNMKNEYNSGDNVHPNNTGHAAISTEVQSSPFLNYFENFSNNILSIFSTIRRLI